VYTVRLTVNGKSMTQPIAVKMDPRVRITPAVEQIFTLTAQMEDNARAAAAAYREARALVDTVKARPQSAANDALLKQLEELAPPEPAGGSGRGGRGGRFGGATAEPAPPANLSTTGSRMVAAAMSMQGAEMPPTAAQLEACTLEQAAFSAVMSKWAALKARVNPPAAPAAAKK
jgi:hypothetical protein